MMITCTEITNFHEQVLVLRFEGLVHTLPEIGEALNIPDWTALSKTFSKLYEDKKPCIAKTHQKRKQIFSGE